MKNQKHLASNKQLQQTNFRANILSTLYDKLAVNEIHVKNGLETFLFNN